MLPGDGVLVDSDVAVVAPADSEALLLLALQDVDLALLVLFLYGGPIDLEGHIGDAVFFLEAEIEDHNFLVDSDLEDLSLLQFDGVVVRHGPIGAEGASDVLEVEEPVRFDEIPKGSDDFEVELVAELGEEEDELLREGVLRGEGVLGEDLAVEPGS